MIEDFNTRSPSPLRASPGPAKGVRNLLSTFSKSTVDDFGRGNSNTSHVLQESQQTSSLSSPSMSFDRHHKPSSAPSRALFTTSSSAGRPVGETEEDKLVLKRLQTGLVEISSKADLILMNVGRLLRALNPGERRVSAPPNMPSLPLNTKDDLNKFESFLGGSDVNLASVCDYMASYTKTTAADPERKSAQSILSKLLTNNLAKCVNLEGGNNKISFRALNLYKVFQGTLQAAFKDSDLTVADNALQKWLKDAKWRKQNAMPNGA